MSENEIREPIQKRSIAKKEKIIKSGFELVCEKGYHNTNTAEIAKNAGVSTGIVYQYFKDKHDIFICGLEKYADSIFYPIPNISSKNFDKNKFPKVIKKMIDSYIKCHKLSKTAHEEIMAMTHSDKDVAYYYYKREMDITIYVVELLKDNNFKCDHLIERVHIAIGMIDNLCHEIVYHKHENIDYNAMTEIVTQDICKILY